MRSPHIHALSARLATEHRRKTRDPQRIEDLRYEIKVAGAEEYIADLLSSAPPLSEEDRYRLAGILTAGGAA